MQYTAIAAVILISACASSVPVDSSFKPSDSSTLVFGRLVQSGCDGLGQSSTLKHHQFHISRYTGPSSFPTSPATAGEFMHADLFEDHFAIRLSPGQYILVEFALRNGPRFRPPVRPGEGGYAMVFSSRPSVATYIGTFTVSCTIARNDKLTIGYSVTDEYSSAQPLFAQRFTAAGELLNNVAESRNEYFGSSTE
jgi:hypothetical protein